METLGLNWLGSPQALLNGIPVKFETRKAAALLAVLSLDRRPQSREFLATLFWPEYDSVRAPANLRRTLASLQASLGPGWIHADREAIHLGNQDSIQIDSEQVLSRIREVRTHHPAGDSRLCASCANILVQAVKLCHGEFMKGFNLKECPGFDRWQLEKRDALSQELGWALELLVEAKGESGDLEAAIPLAQRWLALDELHEPAHRALMFLYARSGKRTAALRQFDACTRLLREELGLEVEASTKTLYECIKQRGLEKTGVDTVARPRLESQLRQGAPGPEPQAEPDRGSIQAGTGLKAPNPEMGASMDRLATRLRPPPRRPVLVQRSRLLAQLDGGTRRPVTLVSAPAGFGKTTLLAEWARTCGLPVAWLSLEEADSDGAHLLAGLVAALGVMEPGIGIEASQMLRAMQTPPLNAIADSLFHDLERRSEHRVLVLDDYHLISRPAVEDYLSAIILRMPENLHLFIATRVDPSLPLARMRAHAQLVELRADDLRFQPEEAAGFLREVMGLDLQDADISLLEQRTEGWAAGLQMAALSLQGRADRSQFIRNFGGSHRYIMDYLMGEVLDGQPPAIQNFLLCTSILDRFQADLCNELAGCTDSQTILESLDRDNLFLVALDDERRWYRYHHLFAELLRHRLGLHHSAAGVAALHLKAGRWLEKAADIEGAMQHYLTGGNHDEALWVIREHHMSILTRGGLSMLLGWRSRIPDDIVAGRPDACVTIGSICAWAGKATDAERYFSQAEALRHGTWQEDSEDARTLRGMATIMRAFIADVAGQTDRAVSLAREADELLPARYTMERVLVPYILSKAYRYRGELEKAEELYAGQIRLARAANNIWALSGAIHELIWLCRFRGRLRDAYRILDEFEAIPREPGTDGPVAKTTADRAEIERERGQLESAARIIRKPMEDVLRWGMPSDVAACHLTRLRIELSSGQVEEAEADLDRLDTLVRSSQVYATLLPLIEVERVHVFLARGRVSEAERWMDTYQYPEDGSVTLREVIRIARARVMLAAGKVAEARVALDQLAKEAEAAGRFGRLLEILALRAVAGPEEAARTALRCALGIAEPEGYVSVFLDEGKPLLARLQDALDHPDTLAPGLAAYARHLLSLRSL